MPKITINEIDSSRYVSPTKNAPMTVLVPGTASFGPVFSQYSPNVSTFNGEQDLPLFFNSYGIVPAQVKQLDGSYRTLTDDNCFEYVTNLIRSGATVQFYRLNEGVSASNSGAVTTDNLDVLIQAKYSGSFGNYLVVQLKVANFDPSTDCVLNIYRNNTPSTAPIDPTTITLNDLAKMTRVYTGRVSIIETSPFFVENNTNEFVTISREALIELMEMASQNSGSSGTEDTITLNLYGGSDYPNTDISTIREAYYVALLDSYKAFTDPYLFDFDFVTSGGYVPTLDENSATTTPTNLTKLHKTMVELCETRKDCIALIDVCFGWDADTTIHYASGFNTSYSAIYAPWCSFVSTISSKTIYMPPSLIFLKAILYGMQTQTESELWYVPAGVSRASTPFVVSPEYEIGSTTLNEFQNDNDYKVNPIMRLRNYGYCVYGNSTSLQSVPGLPHSALESMNVRLISNVIKKRIFEVCCGLSFDYNNSELWLKFYTQMDETLLYMKRHYGLYDYQIIMDSSTVTDEMLNERRVPGKILISPTLAGEYFDIDFEILPSGVTFTAEGE